MEGETGSNHSDNYVTGSEEQYEVDGTYNPFNERLTYTGILSDFRGYHKLIDDANHDPINNARGLKWFAESDEGQKS